MFTLLTRIDPDEQMNRWYIVAVQSTLFEPIAVITAWGSRNSDWQQWRAFPAESLAAAQETAESIIIAKQKRGYQIVQKENPLRRGG